MVTQVAAEPGKKTCTEKGQTFKGQQKPSQTQNTGQLLTHISHTVAVVVEVKTLHINL